MYPEFKYQILFTCSVPAGVESIKDFSEIITADAPMSENILLQTIRLSFESAGLNVKRMDLSNNLTYCDVFLDEELDSLRVTIRQRPSLVVGDKIFKLEDFDF